MDQRPVERRGDAIGDREQPPGHLHRLLDDEGEPEQQAELFPGLPRFGVARGQVAAIEVLAARTGYTGEDGFEVYCPSEAAPRIWDRILEEARAVLAETAPDLARTLERTVDPLAELPMTVASSSVTSHVVLVGYGRVGRRIGESLTEQGLPLVVAEQNREMVEGLRKRGIHAVAGDAAEPAVLIQAHIARANMLVIAIPDTLRARRMIETARMLNPQIEIIIRTHNDEEAALLHTEGAGTVFLGEHELALSMTRHILEKIAAK